MHHIRVWTEIFWFGTRYFRKYLQTKIHTHIFINILELVIQSFEDNIHHHFACMSSGKIYSESILDLDLIHVYDCVYPTTTIEFEIFVRGVYLGLIYSERFLLRTYSLLAIYFHFYKFTDKMILFSSLIIS